MDYEFKSFFFFPPNNFYQPSPPRIVDDEFHHAFDLLEYSHPPHFPLDEFDAVADLIRFEKTPFRTSTRRVRPSELYLQAISDRVSELEIGFERPLKEEKARNKKQNGERKYTWTAEIEEPDEDRKYKWMAGIKSGEDGSDVLEKSYKFTAQIKGKGKGGDCHRPIERSYTVKVSSGGKSEKETKKKKGDKVKEKGKQVGPTAHIIEI
ncbi:PREDICTED: BAG family molecular chaperone regulator 7-like, partial [Erythranthe guttata]|uniref:BAG family molecular chaperone regulator 7-like n=1 Tax=Erythranthe guttata TaxID=4155 RepID=UPI00064DDCCF